MEAIQALFTSTLAVFQVELTLFGFTFSMWDVFIWTLIAGIVIAFIGGLLFHD